MSEKYSFGIFQIHGCYSKYGSHLLLCRDQMAPSF
jgi:hypothetical protein